MGGRSLLENAGSSRGLGRGRGERPPGTPGAPARERGGNGGKDETRGYVHGQEDEEEDALSGMMTTSDGAWMPIVIVGGVVACTCVWDLASVVSTAVAWRRMRR